ncbi:MAG: sodium/proton-translocating pyrophosphatase, partial [Acidimicrobiia bacterium]
MTDTILYIALVAGALALVLAVYYTRGVLAAPQGNERMVELSSAIRDGAMAFLRREYTWVSVFVVVMAALIATLLEWGRPWGAVAYVFGASLSALAGFVGMRIATAANARTTEAARVGGIPAALPVAFRGGAVMGFTVAGLGLLGVGLGFWLFNDGPLADPDWVDIITAIGLGGSSIALFARVGGGIYTKAADVGADLVGKVEAGIPEDDPRNPAVIADNVGDNVGDVAGMGADLFESYVGSLVAPVAYSIFVFSDELRVSAVVFPLAVAALGMFASMIGSFLVRAKDEGHLAAALHRGTNFAMIVTAIGVGALAYWVFGDVADNWAGVWIAVVAGLIVGWFVGKISEWFTSDHHKTVKEIARQS